MDAAEVGHRVEQTLHARLQRIGLKRARFAEPNGSAGRPWATEISADFDATVYRGAADRILAGDYRVFAIRANIGFPPQWNCDPKTGTQAPLLFGKTLDYRDERVVGDIKYLWEPNRHLELVTLAQAWHLTRDDKYALGCRELLDSWFDQCPYLLGPNWTSSLELGIRLVNWSFAWHLLGGNAAMVFSDRPGAKFKRRWLASIYQHCHFIDGHRSRYSSANNHLLGECLGLLIGAVTWPLWRQSVGWIREAKEQFQSEALRQNAEDGVNLEQGIWYHHEVADMMLLAGLISRANGIEFDSGYWARWEAMLDFLSSMMDVAGQVPAFGDADDAVMVRFDPRPAFDPYHSLLASGAVLCNRSDFKLKAGRFDDKSQWLLGDRAAAQFVAIPPPEDPGELRQRQFSQGGYYVLGSDFNTQREVRIVADAGPLGYLSIAAHGHADALSFTASAAGREVLIDPGTYAYHTQKVWRDYFRGTSAHNTVRIDGEDQSVAGGNFMWTHHAEARCDEFVPGGDVELFRAHHLGYQRFADAVIHRRELRYNKHRRILHVSDQIDCSGAHLLEIFWHFAEDCIVSLAGSHAEVTTGSVRARLSWPPVLEARLLKGESAPVAGWRSRSFDSKVPTSTLVLSAATLGTWLGECQLWFEAL